MIVAVPGAIAFTTPFAETVAIFLLLDVQLNVLLVADAGATVAVRVLLLPSVIVSVATESLIEVTGCFTVILHLAYLPLPSLAFAVIYTVPTLTAFTTPFEETVAILLFDDDHRIPLYVAFFGAIEAFNVLLVPLNIFTAFADNVTVFVGTPT